MHNVPHSEDTKRRLSEIRKQRPKQWGHLPQAEIVERLLSTDATIRSIAHEYQCSSSTIKVIFQRHTTKEQRQEVQHRKQAQKLRGYKHHAEFGKNHSKLITGNKNPFYGKKHSEEFKRAQSERKKGVPASEATRKAHSAALQHVSIDQWTGFISKINELARRTTKYKEWRESVFKRDSYTCRMCGKRGGHLHPHHIKTFSAFPELRYDVKNGVTLCANPCHKKTFNHEVEYEHMFINE